MMQRLAIVIVALALPSLAAAETRWHAGLNLRADLGTHPIRIGGGVQTTYVDTTLVLDPMFWTDGQHDIDALAFWAPCTRAWGLFGGWRASAIGILGGRQIQEKFLAGIGAPLPRLAKSIR